jgi:uncharacterized membrane protein YheB (UPF0754 family)
MKSIYNKKYRFMDRKEKEFIERYFKLESSLRYEVRKRMQIIYAIQNRDFCIPVILNNYVDKTEKEMLLNMIKNNADKINTLLEYEDWEIISNSKLDELIEEYFNENPELEQVYRTNTENDGLPF